MAKIRLIGLDDPNDSDWISASDFNGGNWQPGYEIWGMAGHDFLFGSRFNDDIFGGGGQDFLFGFDGNDTLDGGAGNDILSSGEHDDTLIGGEGNDRLDGGNGTDTASYAKQTFLVGVDLANGTARVFSPAGQVIEEDTLVGIENVIAGDGGSVLFGDGANNTLTGGCGRDRLRGRDGSDTLSGGDDTDYLYGGDGIDTLHGGSGNDFIFGMEDGLYSETTGNFLYGGAGDDVIHGANGADYLYGEENNDYLYGRAGADFVFGGSGKDVLSGGGAGIGGIDVLYGGKGQDTLQGTAGSADRFVFNAEDFTIPGYTNVSEYDSIIGFRRADGDKIDVTDIIITKAWPWLLKGEFSSSEVFRQTLFFVEHRTPGTAGHGTYVYFDPDLASPRGPWGAAENHIIADVVGVGASQLSQYDFVLWQCRRQRLARPPPAGAASVRDVNGQQLDQPQRSSSPRRTRRERWSNSSPRPAAPAIRKTGLEPG